MDFVPLQVMSAYTLLNSTVTIPSLIKKMKDSGYNAVALTDKNVMHGAIEFYKEAKKHGIKPIVGLTIDAYLTKNSEQSLTLVLLAKNNKGYQHLLDISTKIMLNSNKVVLEDLINYSTNLMTIVSSENTFKSNLEELTESLQLISQEFDVTYMGVNCSEYSEEKLSQTLDISRKYELPLVANEPVYSLTKEESRSLKVLKAIKDQETVDYDELNHSSNHYLREKHDILSDYDSPHLSEAVRNTKIISEQINLTFNWETVLPEYKTPENVTSEDYLIKLSSEQLNKKVPNHTEDYKKRLEKELSVINKMGFADYFLIVWDLMAFAHKQNIVTGSGRGSAAGSLVSYVLDITDVDPIQYDLLFDRFLNEERHSLPDIDLDFPDNKREIILNYVLNKYGKEHVAQIATFGTFAAKMAIRDTGRVLGLDSATLKKWSNAIPNQLGMTLKKAYRESRALKELIEESDFNKTLFKIAYNIEGLPRHVSTHAAGVVISKDPLIYSTALQEGSSHMPLTQFTMNDIETVGLLKMDFLGLKNLTILADCISNTPEMTGTIKEKLDSIPLDDKDTLKLFEKGDTNGIFQFESSGIQTVLRRLGASSFEDIVAVNALYRPGPMEQIDPFIARKKGKEPIKYLHPDLKEITEVTNGVMIYQEQVMKVASKIAGYSLAEADILRRAISKKIKSDIDAGRNQFVAGAKQRGYTRETATDVYNHIERFANYGFNRSHAVSYSKLAFQLAYFKAHYPAAFFVSLMKATANNKEKLKTYMLEVKERQISVLPPDINNSEADFTVKNQKINFGLNVIKGLRKDFIQNILYERKRNGPYKDLLTFINRIDERWKKEQTIRPLIHAGCFDQLGENRNTLIHSVEPMIDSVTMSKGNIELFESLAPRYDRKEELSLEERLNQELETTGFYFSGHPTEQYQKEKQKLNATFLLESVEGKYKTYIVLVNGIKRIQTKRGEPMAFVDITDSSGEATCILFPADYRKYGRLVQKDAVMILEGKAEWKKGQLNILTSKLQDISKIDISKEESKEERKVLYLRFKNLADQRDLFDEVLEILKENKGMTPVIVFDQETKRKEKLKQHYNIAPTHSCMQKLTDLLDKTNVILQ